MCSHSFLSKIGSSNSLEAETDKETVVYKKTSNPKTKSKDKKEKKCKKLVSLDSSSDGEAKEKTPKKRRKQSSGGGSDAPKAEQSITISPDKFIQIMNMLK